MKKHIERFLSQEVQFPIVIAIAVAAISFLPKLQWGAISYHDNQRLAQVLVAALGASAVVHQLFRHTSVSSILGKASSLFLVGFFSLGLLSGLLAWSVPHAMFEWANFGLLVVLAWLIAKRISVAQIDVLDRILIICGIGCALYVFSWSVEYVSPYIAGSKPERGVFLPGFDNFRFFNHVQTVTLPLLGLLVIRSRQSALALPSPGPRTLMSLMQRHQARFWWVILMFWWMLFFVTSGRGTFVGLVAGITMALVWRRKHAWAWCRVMIATFIAGLITYQLLYTLVPKLTAVPATGLLQQVATRTVVDPTSSRLALWQSALQMIVDHPLLGVGPLHFAHYGRHVMNGAHPHSWVLQIGAEWGIPALLCLTGVLVMALRALLRTGRMIKAGDETNQVILTAWLATFVAIVVDGLVSGLLVMPTSQLWIALYAGCAWGWTASFSVAGTSAARPARSRGRYAVMLGLVVLMLLVGRGLWPEITDLRAHEDKILSEGLTNGARILFPRIWRAGYF